MAEENNLSYPMPNKKDKMIAGGKTGASVVGSVATIFSGIPLLNIAASELLSRVVTPTLDKRRISWFNNLAIRLGTLEDKHDDFKLTLRLYLPQEAMLNGTWIPPTISRTAG